MGNFNTFIPPREGGVCMERPRAAKDERVWQFIGYCKTCLRFEKLDYIKVQQVAFENEIPIDFIGYLGAYSGDIEIENMLKVMNREIAIKNDLFYESLLKLKKREVDVLYLSVCEEMSDAEISKELNIPRSTVQYLKVKTKEKIRRMMGVQDNDNT